MKMPYAMAGRTAMGMLKRYGARNSVGLGAFVAGNMLTMGAANNTRTNGIGFGNSTVGLVGLGLSGFGGHKLGAQRLFNSGGRRQLANRMMGLSKQFGGKKFNGPLSPEVYSANRNVANMFRKTGALLSGKSPKVGKGYTPPNISGAAAYSAKVKDRHARVASNAPPTSYPEVEPKPGKMPMDRFKSWLKTL